MRFLYADDNEWFTTTVDPKDPTLLHITNSKAIPASTEVFVTFVYDFSKVPVGYTVKNTVGGNTTTTLKMAGTIQLQASKTVDGNQPGNQSFTFTVADENHNVLQTKTNDETGTIAFDPFVYDQDDLGKTFTYYVAEINGQDTKYTYDTTEYEVQFKVANKANDDGQIPTETTFIKNGKPVESMEFSNTTKTQETIEIQGKKTWSDNDNQDGKRPASLTVYLLADNQIVDKQSVSQNNDWTYCFQDLPKTKDDQLIHYTIQEENLPGYQSQVDGYDLINTYTPEKCTVPVIKEWQDDNDQAEKRPDHITIHLLADGEDTGQTLELNEENHWTSAFTDLDMYQEGKRIEYTIREDPIKDYATEIEKDDLGFRIINRLTKQKTPGKEKPKQKKNKKKGNVTPKKNKKQSHTTPTGAMTQKTIWSCVAILSLVGMLRLKRKHI